MIRTCPKLLGDIDFYTNFTQSFSFILTWLFLILVASRCTVALLFQLRMTNRKFLEVLWLLLQCSAFLTEKIQGTWIFKQLTISNFRSCYQFFEFDAIWDLFWHQTRYVLPCSNMAISNIFTQLKADLKSWTIANLWQSLIILRVGKLTFCTYLPCGNLNFTTWHLKEWAWNAYRFFISYHYGPM